MKAAAKIGIIWLTFSAFFASGNDQPGPFRTVGEEERGGLHYLLSRSAPPKETEEELLQIALNLPTNDLQHGSAAAENDPDGHWGTAVDDFQLSVRFRKKIFEVGEPIIATAFLRNVTTNIVGFLEMNGLLLDENIVVADEFRAVARRQPSVEARVRRVTTFFLRPKTQFRCTRQLEKSFILEPGTYTVTFTASIPRTGTLPYHDTHPDNLSFPGARTYPLRGPVPPTVEIRSGEATIHVLGSNIVAAPVVPLPQSEEATTLDGVQKSGRLGTPGFSRPNRREIDARNSEKLLGGSNKPVPPSNGVEETPDASFDRTQKIGMTVILGLLALVILVFWRGARRKPSA